MKIRQFFRKALSVLCMAALAAGIAGAQAETALETRTVDLPGGQIRYPAATGMENEALQKQVNDALVRALGVEAALDRTVQFALSAAPQTLQTEWSGGLTGEELLCVRMTEEQLQGEAVRKNVLTAANIDLRDGHEIALRELFTDEAAARAVLEAYMENEVAPEMSPHLANAELLPLPDAFLLEPTGITFLYPVERLSTLKDRAGEVKIGWNEIREALDLSGDSILARLGAERMITLNAESAARLEETAAEGALPGIPARIGDPLKELTDRYTMLTDPDLYEGGRMFSLAGGSFRDVYLLTDYLAEDWNDSTVQGIRMDRGCAWGLCVGETTQAEWREALGEPDSSEELDPDRAEAWRTAPGARDYYQRGGHLLLLQSDAEGVLCSITLME